MKKWQKITLIGCSTWLVLALFIGIAGFFVLRPTWDECGVPHPGSTPDLIFMQKSIHPFLAEYEY